MAHAADSPYGNIHDLLTCPYNTSHKVGASKFPNHLVKCRKQNPKIAENIMICNFNQSHHIPKEFMAHHLCVCQSYKDHLLHSINTCNPTYLQDALHKSAPDSKAQVAEMKQNEMIHTKPFKYISRKELDEWM